MAVTKIEYRVLPITRYVVTRYEEGNDAANALFAGSVQKGMYDNAHVAFEVAYALCSEEHRALGWGIGDERIVYPEDPAMANAEAD